MSLGSKHIKTEHAGAKHCAGFWGRKKEAKKVCNRLRRVNDKKACEAR